MKRFFGKKQVMLATLAVALGLAVYLNYYFAQSETGPDKLAGSEPSLASTPTTAGRLGDSQYVNAPTSPQPEDGGAEDTETAEELPYFRQARANREAARKEALEILQEMAADVKASQAVIDEATGKMAAVAQALEQESKIESLVKAKGFADCVAYIEEEHCHVVVQAEGLTPAQTLQITEIVTAQSSVLGENIKISAVNS